MSEPYSIKLKQKPCVIKYVEKWSAFLVGTYECCSSSELGSYLSLNYRIGSLVLFTQTDGSDRFSIRETVECKNGGVFDFNVRDDEIYVAHANNTISLYDYDGFNKDISYDKKLVYRNSVKPSEDSSILLTSIDTCSIRNPENTCDKLYTAVGDSKGRLTILCGEDKHNRLGMVVDKVWVTDTGYSKKNRTCQPTGTGDPIWQVRWIHPTVSDTSTLERLHFIVGAENKGWFVFLFYVKHHRIQVLQKNFDFGAGVTSICIEPPLVEPAYPGELHLEAILGSYDETLRRYKIIINTVEVRLRPAVIECIDQVSIKGGGIWRLTTNGENLYIAAMYAGCYRAKRANISSTLTNLTDGLTRLRPVPSGDSESESLPLDYGIDVCQSQGIACLVDYNNRLCLFFEP